SPENVPLRRHLAETLLSLGRAGEAEQEFRSALPLAPDDAELKVGLANAFAQQGKNTHALVIVEELVKYPDVPPRAYVLYARLLLRGCDVDEAAEYYHLAVVSDPALADVDLAERLGAKVAASSEHDTVDDEEVTDDSFDLDEGRVREMWESSSPTDA